MWLLTIWAICMITFTFTFMHLADAFIQSDLQCIQAIHFFFISMCVPWELNPQPFALLTQCSTTEPQEHWLASVWMILSLWLLMYEQEHLCGNQSMYLSYFLYYYCFFFITQKLLLLYFSSAQNKSLIQCLRFCLLFYNWKTAVACIMTK